MLTTRAATTAALKTKTSLLVLPVFDDSKRTALALDGELASSVKTLQKRGDIKGKIGDSLLLPIAPGASAERVLLVGSGSGQMNASQWLKLAQSIAKTTQQCKAKEVTVALAELTVSERDTVWQYELLGRILANSAYQYDTTLSEKKPRTLTEITALCSSAERAAVAQALASGSAVAAGMGLTRELGNLPGNLCTPSYMAEQAKQLAAGSKQLKVSVLEEAKMRELGMHALLSVAAGSEQAAKLVTIEYKGGAKNTAPVVLVGKGITFDTGGISLKPGAGMEEMKFDMCGAATVLGVLKTASALALPLNIVGVIACAENMPSGRATKPGDIVTSMSGKTIEIVNTDAEGRLVLCDALTYVSRYKPACVIDIATLTGACIIALGHQATGLYSNDDTLGRQLFEASLNTEDRAWQMPLWEEYQPQLKSPYADLCNVGGRTAGSVTAACFLANFTKEYRWAHLDIAGTAWNSGGEKSASGRPVPMLVEFLRQQAQAQK